ncbi:auxilin-related protein 2-like isoform X2 [Rhododendron vialii]|uniref:auxilin-related protein 2-like isoform X2 n=1 Tax=Rhododendron vialii TaxID=182163 RepID=UPI00265D6FAD|nr:auxilin-related protein 2-like isoform X2 [Rhododendron vialii]
MDEFGMLAKEYGFGPQGKAAPMAHSSKSNSTGVRSGGSDRFSDVFGGPPKYNGKSGSPLSDFDYDSIFNSTSRGANDSRSKPTSSPPVYDKPVYDEDIFDGLPGLKSKPTSSSARYEDDVFAAGISSPRNRSKSQGQKQSGAFDDLIGNLGRTNKKSETKNGRSSGGFDDLLPGFGSNRPLSEATRVQKTTFNATRPASAVKEDPFVVLVSNSTPAVSSPRLFADPLEEISKPSDSGNTKVSGGAFDDIDPLDGFGKSFPATSSGIENNVKDGSPSRTGSNIGRSQTSSSTETIGKSSFKDSGRRSQKMYTNNFQESNVFDVPSVSTDARKSVSQTASASRVYSTSSEKNSQVEGMFPESHESMEPSDDIWITVSEVPLFTKPTSAPPPSRPPPPIPGRASKSEAGFSTPTARKKGTDSSSFAPPFNQYSPSPKPTRPSMKSAVGCQIDELKDFAIGTGRSNDDESEEVNTNSSGAAASAAAMKEAMDRAEAKFRHAKEVRDKEYAKNYRTKEAVQLQKDEQAMPDDQESEYRGNPERLDRERQLREEEERERRRLEKEREKAREIEREREREKAKQAVERATREARERAAAETRERAAAEVRLKTERIAVHKVQALARERAAVEARERAEKAAADAREKANVEARDKELKEKAAAAAARAESEARRRAERAVVERAAAEARERAAAGARERAAAARMDQQKNDDDLESFFNVSRPGSAPRPRESSPFQDFMPDPRFQNKGGPEGTRKTSPVGASSNGRKASSATNIVDDLTEIFGAAPSSEKFQNVDGESDERRRARLERHQRTKERAAKALAEKNQRDLQTQRDQDERHRIGETLDIEIKRWAAGKEGNLRALLSTMQYVLWPECGWQPVSLTDLITGASVKKVYRRANLCIHPDKVQQKGATLQQKYIAEKVFDLLKEAWNKFNSEELF